MRAFNIKLVLLHLFEKFGYVVSKKWDHEQQVVDSAVSNNYRLLVEGYRGAIQHHEEFHDSLRFLDFVNEHTDISFSQLNQDLLVLYILNKKPNGFFVEFGATDGKSRSNTYLLEKEFGWNGILCEPAKKWHKQLSKNRGSKIDHRCVWSISKESLNFCETPNREFSTIQSFLDIDSHQRKSIKSYNVETISLNDLLHGHQAPDHIDYLSIDTEGSEFDILSTLHFSKYTFGVITVEHNFSANRDRINQLLVSKGYKNIYPCLSQYDDWYVLERV
jgi:FkbM family methyltransferase